MKAQASNHINAKYPCLIYIGAQVTLTVKQTSHGSCYNKLNIVQTCLPTELRPMNTGGIGAGVFRKDCNMVCAGHISTSAFTRLKEIEAEISPHLLHENSHSIGRNQKPLTRTFEGQ